MLVLLVDRHIDDSGGVEVAERRESGIVAGEACGGTDVVGIDGAEVAHQAVAVANAEHHSLGVDDIALLIGGGDNDVVGAHTLVHHSVFVELGNELPYPIGGFGAVGAMRPSVHIVAVGDESCGEVAFSSGGFFVAYWLRGGNAEVLQAHGVVVGCASFRLSPYSAQPLPERRAREAGDCHLRAIGFGDIMGEQSSASLIGRVAVAQRLKQRAEILIFRVDYNFFVQTHCRKNFSVFVEAIGSRRFANLKFSKNFSNVNFMAII